MAQTLFVPDIIRTDACQEALRMGFNPEEVRSAAQATMRNGGEFVILLIEDQVLYLYPIKSV